MTQFQFYVLQKFSGFVALSYFCKKKAANALNWSNTFSWCGQMNLLAHALIKEGKKPSHAYKPQIWGYLIEIQLFKATAEWSRS